MLDLSELLSPVKNQRSLNDLFLYTALFCTLLSWNDMPAKNRNNSAKLLYMSILSQHINAPLRQFLYSAVRGIGFIVRLPYSALIRSFCKRIRTKIPELC